MGLITGLFKLIFGLIGLVFAALGVLCLTFMGIVLAASDGRANNVLGQVWFQHDPFFFIFNSHSIQLAQVVIERKIGIPEIWNPGVTTLLNWPSWIALLTLGLPMLIVGLVLLTASLRRRAHVL